MKNRFFDRDKYKGRKPTNPEERTGEKDERSERGSDRGGYKKRDNDRRGGGGGDRKRGEWRGKKRDDDRGERSERREGTRKEWGSDKPKREWNSDRPRRDDRDRGDRRRSGGGRDGARKEWGNRDRKRDNYRSDDRRSNDRNSSEIKPILEFEEGENEFKRDNRDRGERREWSNDRPRRERDDRRDDRRSGGTGWRGGRDKSRRDFGNRDRSRDRDNRDRDSGSEIRPELGENKYLMYGKHPVLCALQNPKRKIAKIYCSKNSYEVIKEAISAQTIHKPVIEVMEPNQIDRLFDRTKDAVVHNGVVAEVEQLETPEIEAIAEDYKKIVILDKITDPHNAGAIIRSCAAFGVGIVVTKEKDSSPENATIAKTSAGYIEKVAYARLSSVQNSIEYLKNQGFKIIGLSGAAEKSISSFKAPERFVLVTGSEGKGLSPNIQELCDELVKIDISSEVDSLNASVATAIALYALK